MTVDDYVAAISFRYVQPQDPVPEDLLMAIKGHEKYFELVNTRLPVESNEMFSKLSDLLSIPRMSTFAIGAIVNKGVSQLSESCCFVNVGVWFGFTFLAGLVGNTNCTCIGIDSFRQFTSRYGHPQKSFLKRFQHYGSKNHRFYQGDYRDYFAKMHDAPIGLYFYDGDHSYENQLQGLQIAEPFLSEGGIILIDDTNWDSPRRATLDFIADSSNEYEILLDCSTAYNGHPTFWNGIMVLRKRGKGCAGDSDELH